MALGFPLILAAWAMGRNAHYYSHVESLTPHGVCSQNGDISPPVADVALIFYDRVSLNRNVAYLSLGCTSRSWC
jgi:hypothetical protein